MNKVFMQRCIELAKKGRGYTSPNPLVGAVVVHKGKIIGEGYHRKCGERHAEVNAINSIKDKALLRESEMYVSLEPCSHYGKTPPCAQLIINSKIPKVFVACLDPFPAVAGRGVKMLENAGVEVKVGTLEKEALELNKEFITVQQKHRPYVYLKWAQSADGYIDRIRKPEEKASLFSNKFTSILSHKLRAESDAILVGTNTAMLDNPSLTTRLWYGNNPIRVVLDKKNILPQNLSIYNNEANTIKFGGSSISEILASLYEKNIHSVIIEGGNKTLQAFIDENLWDEAFIEISSNTTLNDGIKAPIIKYIQHNIQKYYTSERIHLQNLLS